MQIDGHHTLTYVIARYAGYPHFQADKLAYCAQYVDEATNPNPVKFSNGAMFNRISSAHKMLDYRNTQQLANHLAWIPFHFLPGNQNLPAGEVPHGSFIQRLICKPDSTVARDMLKMVAQHKEQEYGLHLLGIAMHVYADTFAHQGFAGVSHAVNRVEDLTSSEHDLLDRVMTTVASWGLSNTLPLGHGGALSFPDQPYASWRYSNGLGEDIERNNEEDFIRAANAMFQALLCYRSNDPTMNLGAQPNLTQEQQILLRKAFTEIRDEDGDVRHQQWLLLLSQGFFGFEPVELEFHTSGSKSWKEIARGKPNYGYDNQVTYEFTPEFLDSDWKHFHDALKTYRLELIRDVLPKYGICVA